MLSFSTGNQNGILNRVIKEKMKPYLGQYGFIMKGNYFFKQEDTIIKAIKVERFRFNSMVQYAFWLNIELFGGDFSSAVIKKEADVYKTGIPFENVKIGALRGQENAMYTIHADDSADIVWKEIGDDLERYAIPHFNLVNDYRDLLALFPDSNYNSAMLMLKLGKKEESRAYFEKYIEIDLEKIKEANGGEYSETLDSIKNNTIAFMKENGVI